MSSSNANSGWLHDWLRAEGFRYSHTEDDRTFEVEMPAAGVAAVRIVNRAEHGLLLFGSVSAATFPRRGWTVLYPLLSDVNSRLDYGAWVLEPDRERVVFRAALPLRGAAYDYACLREVMAYVAGTMATMEREFESAAAAN